MLITNGMKQSRTIISVHFTDNQATCFDKIAKILDAKNSIKLQADSILFAKSPLTNHYYTKNLSPYDKYKANMKN
jgi:hypothetical protein